MGLSDEERLSGVLACVNSLYKQRGFKSFEFKFMNSLLRRLWADFLSSESNSVHWILGSDSSAGYFSDKSMLGIAFKWQLDKFAEKESGTTSIEQLHEGLKTTNEQFFEMLKFCREFIPDTEKLLYHSGHDRNKAWRVWKIIESYFYYTNRYRDEFSKTLAKTTKTICEIKGRLFDVIASDENFFRAFMVGKIIDRLVIQKEGDVVTCLIMKHNIHHIMRLDGFEKQETWSLFKEFQVSPAPLSADRRMQTLLKLIGHRYHYEHQHKEAVVLISEWNKKHSKDPIDLKKAQALMRAAHVESGKHEKKEAKRHRTWCALTEQEF